MTLHVPSNGIEFLKGSSPYRKLQKENNALMEALANTNFSAQRLIADGEALQARYDKLFDEHQKLLKISQISDKTEK